MQKILTICVPTFNMEGYLRKCLRSMVVGDAEKMADAEVMRDLEVVVVNDGSTDGSSEIAHEYEREYPDTFRVIDKENGQYGSCVNAALKIARGKYIKILDADDWVDTAALASFVHTLRTVDADCFVTRYVIHDVKAKIAKTVELNAPAWNKVLNISDIKMDYNYMRMHQLTWRLSMLRDMNYTQTEGVYYSDTEYAFLPFLRASTIYFCDQIVYQYLNGRDHQSVSHEVMIRSTSHLAHLYQRARSIKIEPDNKSANDLIHRL